MKNITIPPITHPTLKGIPRNSFKKVAITIAYNIAARIVTTIYYLLSNLDGIFATNI